MTDIEILREVEVEWLVLALGQSIANLGYPVGCGQEPHPDDLKRAANKLFDRYAKMIEMARAAGAKEIKLRQSGGTKDENDAVNALVDWFRSQEISVKDSVPIMVKAILVACFAYAEHRGGGRETIQEGLDIVSEMVKSCMDNIATERDE